MHPDKNPPYNCFYLHRETRQVLRCVAWVPSGESDRFLFENIITGERIRLDGDGMLPLRRISNEMEVLAYASRA